MAIPRCATRAGAVITSKLEPALRAENREATGRLDAADRQDRVRRILLWILWANLMLVGVKIGVGSVIGSLAVLGDAAHSGVDAIANVVGLTAIVFASAPPDEEHPYGHSKFETVGALAIAGFLSITCFELVSAAIGRLLSDAPPPRPAGLAVAILAGTMLVNIAVASYESLRGKQLESELLSADARHTWADVFITLSVLGGLGLVSLGFRQADTILAIFVALLVSFSGIQIIRRTVPVLVDRRAVEPERVHRLAASIEGVESVSDIRSRGRPGEGFAELTIRVHPATQVRQAHAIADEVERSVAEELGLSNVVVHVEPSELH